MRFEVEFRCQSKDTGITTLCQSAQNHTTTAHIFYLTLMPNAHRPTRLDSTVLSRQLCELKLRPYGAIQICLLLLLFFIPQVVKILGVKKTKNAKIKIIRQVNWQIVIIILDDSGSSPRENLKSEHAQSTCPIHTVQSDATRRNSSVSK